MWRQSTLFGAWVALTIAGLENQFCLDLCKLMCSTRAYDGVWTKKGYFRLCEWIDLYSVVIDWQDSYEMLQKAIDKNLRNAIQNIKITTVSTRGRMGMTFATVSRDGPVRLVKFLNRVRWFEIPVAGVFVYLRDWVGYYRLILVGFTDTSR